MITLRRAGERGRTELDWLSSRHTFAFGEYHDPAHMGFRALRVINEDRVQPGMGFGTHGHQDMEILSLVLSGALEHKDDMGHGSVIHPGEIQFMRAGTGVMHSEYNPSPVEPVHFLQIWILPGRRGLPPAYAQKTYDGRAAEKGFALLASRDGREGTIRLEQDAELLLARLKPGSERHYPLAADRHAWVQVARGNVRLNGHALTAGDGAAVTGEHDLELASGGDNGGETAEVLVFELG